MLFHPIRPGVANPNARLTFCGSGFLSLGLPFPQGWPTYRQEDFYDVGNSWLILN